MLGCRKKCITYFHEEVNLPAYPAAMGLWDEVGSPRSLGKVAAKLAATSSPGVSAAAVSPGRSAPAAAAASAKLPSTSTAAAVAPLARRPFVIRRSVRVRVRPSSVTASG